MKPLAKASAVELARRSLREAEELVAALEDERRGVLLTDDDGHTAASLHRELIISLAAKHRLPAVYGGRVFVDNGGFQH
jgi:putative ABC transport system substrate-binding protein